jgi:hypothetical protein
VVFKKTKGGEGVLGMEGYFNYYGKNFLYKSHIIRNLCSRLKEIHFINVGRFGSFLFQLWTGVGNPIYPYLRVALFKHGRSVLILEKYMSLLIMYKWELVSFIV